VNFGPGCSGVLLEELLAVVVSEHEREALQVGAQVLDVSRDRRYGAFQRGVHRPILPDRSRRLRRRQPGSVRNVNAT